MKATRGVPRIIWQMAVLIAVGAVGCAASPSKSEGTPAGPRFPDSVALGSTVPVATVALGSPSPGASAQPAASSSASSVDEVGKSTGARIVTDEELTFSTGGTGKLPATTIRKVLRDKMPAYLACYEKARERTPELKGRFAAAFRIEPSGAVSAVEMRGSRKDPAFSSCLAGEVKALKFPKPKGGVVEVVYPLDFSGD